MESTPSSSVCTEVPSLLSKAIQRLASQSATCKWVSVVLATVTVLFAAGRSGGEILLWAVTPAILLALADAGYLAKAKGIAEAVTKPNAKIEAMKVSEFIQLQVSNEGLAGAKKILSGLFSLTVWPFYLALAVVVVGLGNTVLKSPKGPSTPTSPLYPQQMMSGQAQQFSGAPPNVSVSQLQRPYPGNPGGSYPPGYPGSPYPQGGPSAAPGGPPSSPGAAYQTSRFPNSMRPAPPSAGGPSSPKGSAPVNGQPQGRPTPGANPGSGPSSSVPSVKPTSGNRGPAVPLSTVPAKSVNAAAANAEPAK